MYKMLQKMQVYDPDLKLHCVRVAKLAIDIGFNIGLQSSQLNLLQAAALVHDIGKVYISPKILSKPGKLTEEERMVVDMHSLLGYFEIKASGYPIEMAEIVLLHHGDKGFLVPYSHSICPLADIVRACDIYDAVTHDRPYHEHVSGKEGLKIVRGQKDLAEEILDALEARSLIAT